MLLLQFIGRYTQRYVIPFVLGVLPFVLIALILGGVGLIIWQSGKILVLESRIAYLEQPVVSRSVINPQRPPDSVTGASGNGSHPEVQPVRDGQTQEEAEAEALACSIAYNPRYAAVRKYADRYLDDEVAPPESSYPYFDTLYRQ